MTRNEADGKITVFISHPRLPQPRREGQSTRGPSTSSDDDLDRADRHPQGHAAQPDRQQARLPGHRPQATTRTAGPSPAATCSGATSPATPRSIFNITEGPKVRVRGIEFAGNTFVSGGVLSTHINIVHEVPRPALGGTLQPGHGRRRHRQAGGVLQDVRLPRRAASRASCATSPTARTSTLVFHIQEGLRYRVQDTPQVDGVKRCRRSSSSSSSKIKRGRATTTRPRSTGDIDAHQGLHRHHGRDARCRPTPVYDRDTPGLVRCNYEVEERPPARVGQIFIVGNERTRQNVILRQLPLYPGQVLDLPRPAQLAERNLARLEHLRRQPRRQRQADGHGHRPRRPEQLVQGHPRHGAGGQHRQPDVRRGRQLRRRPDRQHRPERAQLRHPPAADQLRRPAQRQRLPRGRPGVPHRGGARHAAAALHRQLPRAVPVRHARTACGVSGYYYQRQYNEYNEDRLGGRVTLGRKLNQYWSVSRAACASRTSTSATSRLRRRRSTTRACSRQQLPGRRRASASTYDTPRLVPAADRGQPARRSLRAGASATTPSRWSTSSCNKYFTIYQRADGSGRHVLALHSQVGWAGTNTPVFERFFAGGFRSIRGFQFRGVGPDVNGFKVGGDFMFLNSLEYQIPVLANDQHLLRRLRRQRHGGARA